MPSRTGIFDHLLEPSISLDDEISLSPGAATAPATPPGALGYGFLSDMPKLRTGVFDDLLAGYAGERSDLPRDPQGQGAIPGMLDGVQPGDRSGSRTGIFDDLFIAPKQMSGSSPASDDPPAGTTRLPNTDFPFEMVTDPVTGKRQLVGVPPEWKVPPKPREESGDHEALPIVVEGDGMVNVPESPPMSQRSDSTGSWIGEGRQAESFPRQEDNAGGGRVPQPAVEAQPDFRSSAQLDSIARLADSEEVAASPGQNLPAANKVPRRSLPYKIEPYEYRIGPVEGAVRSAGDALLSVPEFLNRSLGMFPYMEDKAIEAITGKSPGIYEAYYRNLLQGLEEERASLRPKEGETFTPLGEIGYAVGPLARDLPLALATAGASTTITAAPAVTSTATSAAPTITNALRALAPHLSRAAVNFAPSAAIAGSDAASEKARAGGSATEQAVAAITTAALTDAAAIIPLGAPSSRGTLMGRFAERAATGVATAFPANALIQQAQALIEGRTDLSPDWKKAAIEALPMAVLSGFMGGALFSTGLDDRETGPTGCKGCSECFRGRSFLPQFQTCGTSTGFVPEA